MDNPCRSDHIKVMTVDADILIVGGGLTGSLLALALSRTGHSVCVLDSAKAPQEPSTGFDGRSYAMALASCRLLTNLGLWPALAPNAQPILEIKVSDGHAGNGASPFFMHFDHAEIEEGPMGHMLEHRHLATALASALRDASNVTLIYGATVVSQGTNGALAEVTLEDGEVKTGHLLVGADGQRGATAQRAGINRTGWTYNQTALVCAIEHEKPHMGIAHQFFMPQGPLAILPLTGTRSSIVWSEEAQNAAEFIKLSDEDFLTLLHPRVGDLLGSFELLGPRHSFPLGLSLAQRMTDQRLALIGDAAHGVHPIAGQGLNAGIRDIAALFDVISDAAQRGEDIGGAGVLSAYERWRSFDNTLLAVATDSFNRLFSNENPALQTVRRLGMGAISHWPGLRRSFIREAAGLTGTLPSLMQMR